MTMIETPTRGYDAVYHGLALHDEHAAGRIWVRGRDRSALLHRLSTNNIERLRPGAMLQTVFTTAIGRIIDLVTVYATDDALLLITSPGQGPLIFGLLRKNIFFQDQVTLEPAGRTHGLLALYGPEAERVAAVGPVAAANAWSIPIATPIGGGGVRLLVPEGSLDTLRAALLEAGAVTLDEATFDVVRVEHGHGAFGRELSEAYIPLETELDSAISFTKGCYVGQEIIARMESRGRRAKGLRGLRLSAPLGDLTLPAKLVADGKDAGDLTSAVASPQFGPIALGYVRSAHLETGTELAVAGSAVRATVTTLPFST